MKRDKERDKKIDLIIKIVLIIIIILLLIHNCMLQKCNKKRCQDTDTIDINCDGNQCNPAPTPTPMQIISLSFAQDKVSVKKGDSQELIVLVYPTELSNEKLTWASSDSKIVKVDDNGVVTGVNVGKATITVKSSNGKEATCIVEVTQDEVKVKSINLKPNKVTIKSGSTTQIAVTIKPDNATNRTLVWTSSNPSVATVNSKGVVKALKSGTVTITAKTKDGKIIATSTITVEVAPKQIESLSFAQKNVSVKKGESLGLVVKVEPTLLSNEKLTWLSSDSKIATVDENGVVTGVSAGKTTITVISSNGKKATCTVEVTTDTVEVKEIELVPDATEIGAGSMTQVSAIIKPEKATNRELVWMSSDPSIATVDDKGIVKGLKSGTVTITAKTKDGKVVAKTTITIKTSPTPTPMQIESLSFAQSSVSVKKGNTLGLTVTVEPIELSNKKLTWKSSNTEIVTVDENGVITGVNLGTATITVTSSNGKKATCTVEVVTNTIPVESIELTPSSATINVGDTIQITATINPSNATDHELVWTSSNSSVVTVDNNGVITGKSAGTATITAKTKDGKVVATSTITVNVPTTPTPTPEGFKVYDNDKTPISWNGSSDLNIFANSISSEGTIAPESKGTYEFKIKNSTNYIMQYDVRFDEENDSYINMKYKLKRNDTYVVDHYVSAAELIIEDQLINSNSEDIYYLEWYWQSSADDTNIGTGPTATYTLKINVEAESIDG